MRRFIVSVSVAAALVAAAPVSAQRVSLADRVAALEQRAADTSAQVDLANQLSQLRNEVQSLRSQLEELQQENEQLRATNRAQYLDLDGRLNRLETPPVESEPVSSATDPTGPAAPASTAAVAGEVTPAVVDTPDEREAYNLAFSALRNGRYEESAGLFDALLTTFPEGATTANSLYWLGESHYGMQNYDRSITAFQALVERFPNNDRAPGALLKVGLAQYELRQLDDAEATFSRVTSRFPGSDAARTADDRLRAIQLTRLR